MISVQLTERIAEQILNRNQYTGLAAGKGGILGEYWIITDKNERRMMYGTGTQRSGKSNITKRS